MDFCFDFPGALVTVALLYPKADCFKLSSSHSFFFVFLPLELYHVFGGVQTNVDEATGQLQLSPRSEFPHDCFSSTGNSRFSAAPVSVPVSLFSQRSPFR